VHGGVDAKTCGSETFRGTEIRRPSVEVRSHQTSGKAEAWKISFQLGTREFACERIKMGDAPINEH